MSPSSFMMMEGISALCAGSVGLMFLTAGVGKLREHDVFLGDLAAYRLLPSWMLEPAAWGLGAVEVATGALLFSGIGREAGSLLAAGLLIAFVLAMGVNMLRGRTDLSCGCTPGRKGETLSWPLVLRTGLLLGPALASGVTGTGSSILLDLEGLVCGAVLWVLWQALRTLSVAPVSGGEPA